MSGKHSKGLTRDVGIGVVATTGMMGKITTGLVMITEVEGTVGGMAIKTEGVVGLTGIARMQKAGSQAGKVKGHRGITDLGHQENQENIDLDPLGSCTDLVLLVLSNLLGSLLGKGVGITQERILRVKGHKVKKDMGREISGIGLVCEIGLLLQNDDTVI